MSDYIKIDFEFLSIEQKEITIALLSEMNYQGFEEEGDLLKAYIPSAQYDEKKLISTLSPHNISFSVAKIENRNWNQLWESSFQPVVINHATSNSRWVAIRAAFHKPITDAQYEIIITPKMSFGTGHHATTLLMIKMMSELDFKGKVVLDFGTGTGVLAILAEKLGAARILAIDNDPHSIENSTENFVANNCEHIELQNGSAVQGTDEYDIILSNITKTVIRKNLPDFGNKLSAHGNLLLSGLVGGDEKVILETAAANRLVLNKKSQIGDWLGFQFIHE